MPPPFSFSDFHPGIKLSAKWITITEAHVVQFAGLSGDYNPIHINDIFAKESIFNSRIAHGALIISLTIGDLSQFIMGTTIALLEVHSKFLKPVKIGDTIHIETEVLEKVPSKKYNGGTVTFRHIVKNQSDEDVTVLESKILISNGLATRNNVLRHD